MVLLTGYSGFLGSYILSLLDKRGIKVTTIGRGKHADLSFDLAKNIDTIPEVERVIHCAGMAHSYPKSAGEKEAFKMINLNGTINLCDALARNRKKPLQFVFISTVAVYGKDEGEEITEEFELLGTSLYAKSKIEAERFLESWGKINNVKILILRLPLIVGNNPPGNLGKLIKGIKRGTYFSIAGGMAKKSMVLADDIAAFILINPDAEGIYNLTDGRHPTFAEIEAIVCKSFGKNKPINLPKCAAVALGKLGNLIPKFPINSETIDKITSNLTFNDNKARLKLNWSPRSVAECWNINDNYNKKSNYD